MLRHRGAVSTRCPVCDTAYRNVRVAPAPCIAQFRARCPTPRTGIMLASALLGLASIVHGLLATVRVVGHVDPSDRVTDLSMAVLCVALGSALVVMATVEVQGALFALEGGCGARAAAPVCTVV